MLLLISTAKYHYKDAKENECPLKSKDKLRDRQFGMKGLTRIPPMLLIEQMAHAFSVGSDIVQALVTLKKRQFKSEVQQCLMYVHRILQKGFDSQAISSVDC